MLKRANEAVQREKDRILDRSAQMVRWFALFYVFLCHPNFQSSNLEIFSGERAGSAEIASGRGDDAEGGGRREVQRVQGETARFDRTARPKVQYLQLIFAF